MFDLADNRPIAPIAIAGIHTDIGKTVCSAVLVQALGYDYWKPVQAGALEHSDTMLVHDLVTRSDIQFHAEAHRFELAASPHVAARAENIEIQLGDFTPPTLAQARPLLIETAGGVCSPMSDTYTVADVLAYFDWATILVVRHYLGSISHTVSAVDALQKRGVRLLGIIVNGDSNKESEQFIKDYTGVPGLARIPTLPALTRECVADVALLLQKKLIF